MNFKKRVNGSWTDAPHYIHNTSTDTITTLPAVLYPNAATATVRLKGNTVQSGTPTPDSPVMPQGTGERTGNLFDKESLNIINNRYLRYNGELDASSNHIVSDFMLISGTHITISNTSVDNTTSQCFYDDNKNFISSFKLNEIPKTIEIPNNAKFIRCTVPKTRRGDFMLNSGSTALPYEPYGYKIPISSAGQTTPVYLGEVESTRRIKKIEVEIEQVLTLGNGNKGGVTKAFSGGNAKTGAGLGVCDRALYGGSSVVGSFYVNQVNAVFIGSPTDTLNDFKSKYNRASLWYVLANEETAVVNEPLMKIGEYADSISGISIPTTAGANTLNVLTTVQPSEVTATFDGWHPVSSAHERSGGSWT